MNTKHKSTPELVATCRTVNTDGNDNYIGDKLVGIQIEPRKAGETAVVQIDIRDFRAKTNLVVEIELAELVAAISQATLHAEVDGD